MTDPDKLLKSMKRHATELEARLIETVPDFRKWRSLLDTIATYEAVSQTAAAVIPVTVAAPPVEKPKAKREVIVPEAIKYLREIGRRVNSTTMAEELEKRGIELAGKNKAGTLAAYLSEAKHLIDNVRGEGYGLREWSVAKPSGGSTPESEGPDTEMSGPSSTNGHHQVFA